MCDTNYLLNYNLEISFCIKVNESFYCVTESWRLRFSGPEFARTNLRRQCYESADKTSTGHPSLRLSRQLGELRPDLSLTCCSSASGSQECCLRNGEFLYNVVIVPLAYYSETFTIHTKKKNAIKASWVHR